MAKKAKTKTWYIKQHSDSRGESWFVKLKMDFPVEEHMLIIAAVLVQAAYFRKDKAEAQYKEFVKWRMNCTGFTYPRDPKEWNTFLDSHNDVPYPDFLGEVIEPSTQVKITKTGAALCGEEWNCGIATTQKEATRLYDVSAPGGEFTDEW